MQPAAPLPSFLSTAPAARPARPRLLDLPRAAMPADVYRPAQPVAYQPQPVPYQPYPAGYQPQPVVQPVFSPQGQFLGYVAAPQAPIPAPSEPSANQRVGQATLTTVTAGLGVAGVFAPPVLPIAGVVGLVQALDTQIGHPISRTLGTVVNGVAYGGKAVVNGVADGGRAVGKFFGKLFGG